MPAFGSQDVCPRVWVSQFGFGCQGLDVWVSMSGFGSLGLGPRIWISGVWESGFVYSDLVVCVLGFGSLSFGVWVWCFGFCPRMCFWVWVPGFVPQDLHFRILVCGFGSKNLGL